MESSALAAAVGYGRVSHESQTHTYAHVSFEEQLREFVQNPDAC